VAIAARQRWLDDLPCHRQIGRGGLLGDRVVMSRRLVRFGRQLWIVLILCWLSATAFAKDYPTAPRLKDNHGKFRVAYLQGGPFFEYDEVLAALVHALARNGWARQITIPPEATRTAQDLFAYLAAHKEWSDYLEFPPDAFFDSGWQDRSRAANQQKILKRTDIDMILAFGTWAGSDMKEMPKEFDRVPVVVVDVSDPLRSRIVDSNQDTGRDSLTARVDPRRYQRQVRLFHDVVGFRKLGVAFEGTVEGRSYAAIEDIDVVARKKGFTVVKAEHPGYFKSRGEAEKWLIRSARELAARVDAFYLTQQLGLNDQTLPQLIEIFNQKKIPVFSQTGSAEVKKGVLLSIATAGYRHEAEYQARKIAQILNGAKPRDLPLLFEDPANIAINLNTARKIGFDPPVDILEAADEIIKD